MNGCAMWTLTICQGADSKLDEAILSETGKGDIFWTFDREEKKETGIHKLCIIDTGPGMSGEDIRLLINQMYSSGKNQEITGNFGIGTKSDEFGKGSSRISLQIISKWKGYWNNC